MNTVIYNPVAIK